MGLERTYRPKVAHCEGVKDETGPLETDWKEMRDSKAPREDAYHWRHSIWASPQLDHCAAHSAPVASAVPALLSIHSTLAMSLSCGDQRYSNAQIGTGPSIVHKVFVSLIT